MQASISRARFQAIVNRVEAIFPGAGDVNQLGATAPRIW